MEKFRLFIQKIAYALLALNALSHTRVRGMHLSLSIIFTFFWTPDIFLPNYPLLQSFLSFYHHRNYG